jgi:hypothetical protein
MRCASVVCAGLVHAFVSVVPRQNARDITSTSAGPMVQCMCMHQHAPHMQGGQRRRGSYGYYGSRQRAFWYVFTPRVQGAAFWQRLALCISLLVLLATQYKGTPPKKQGGCASRRATLTCLAPKIARTPEEQRTKSVLQTIC